ncbi:MAG: ribosome small subunit-dependent GTPase A [Chloroflexi bacterium]|nr:ribosome small subunit-dependent GTPase A [Chloroflexota bacterium]
MPTLIGLVLRAQGGYYYVWQDGQLVVCSLRGRLKQHRTGSDLIAPGDRVTYEITEPQRGVITDVLPRKSAFSRTPPPPRRPIEQVIVANADQVLVVFAVTIPPPNSLMLDRFLVASEAAQLPAMIAFNKIDEAAGTQADELIARYRRIGYSVYAVSAHSGAGLEALKAQLHNKLTVLVGPSGVGKSSLLNAWWPQLERVTGEVSEYHSRGRHTTSAAELLLPEEGVLIADTPGLRQLRYWQVEPGDLAELFIEFRPWLVACAHEHCQHLQEPGCAIRAATERGDIAPERYDSYTRMRALGF